jgi:hypothetical protein
MASERFAGHHWDSVFAFFKHEESTEGPELARRLLDLHGQIKG